MNTTDLRDELTALAEPVTAPPTLADGVATKITATRRRRTGLAAAGAGLAVAAIAVGVVGVGTGRAPAPAPASRIATDSGPAPMIGADGMPLRAVPDASGDVVKDGLRFHARVGDDLLAGGVVGDPGQQSLAVRFTPTTNRVSYAAECFVSAATPEEAMALHVRAGIAGVQGYLETSCSTTIPDELPAGGIIPGEPGQGSPDLVPGTAATLTVQVVDKAGRAVSRPDVRLVGAVYELGRWTPVTDASGRTVDVVPDAREHGGYTYRLASLTTATYGTASDTASVVAPQSGPYLVTYGSAGVPVIGGTPTYFAVDGLDSAGAGQVQGSSAGAGQVQGSSATTANEPDGRGQYLTLRATEGPRPTKGTGFIAVYILER